MADQNSCNFASKCQYKETERKHENPVVILNSTVSLGGGLILLASKGYKPLQPSPDVTATIDGIGLPSPLEPETNYVGVRRLHKKDIQKIEGSNKFSPKVQQRESDIQESFQPADSILREKKSAQFSPLPPQLFRDSNSVGTKDPEREKKTCENAAFPSMVSYQPLHTCCENLLEASHSPATLAATNKKCHSKETWRDRLPSTINSLPIYAVRVRWKLSPNLPCYTVEMVHALLSRHGTVKSMGQISPNAAMVVFGDVPAARRAISCSGLGLESYPLICVWWFPEMSSYSKMIHEQNLREEKIIPVHFDEATLMKMEFRKIQEKCRIQLKKYVGNLSYDKRTFVP